MIILHEARSGVGHQPDVDHIRVQLTEEQRLHLRGIASSWKADVAWAAATDRLELFTDHPEYPLWKAVRTNASGIALLKARLQTEQHWLKRAELLAYAATPNLDHLRLTLHREPTVQDIVQDLTQRWTKAFTGLRRQLGTDVAGRLFTRRGERS